MTRVSATLGELFALTVVIFSFSQKLALSYFILFKGYFYSMTKYGLDVHCQSPYLWEYLFVI